MKETTPLASTGTEEAMSHLNNVHAVKIAWGMHVAVQHAKANLTVHSREVRQLLVNKGIIDDDNEAKEFWLGAVFRNLKDANILEKTGTMYKYSDPKRGINERTVAQWQLKKGADTSKYDAEPPRKPFGK